MNTKHGIAALSLPISVGLLLVILSLAMPTLTRAQSQGVPQRVGLNVALIAAQPVGDFGDAVKNGFGGTLGGLMALDRRGIFSIRGDLGFLVYGSEKQQVPLVSRIQVDITTTNTIGLFTFGPQLAIQSGPLRPYAHGFIGWSYFTTKSSLSGTNDDDDQDDYFTTEHARDGVVSVGGEGGFLIPISTGKTPVALDLGARYMHNGMTRYLAKGDIRDNPDGTVSYTMRETDTNLWIYRIGVRVGAW
jgi:hypothetical protein